MERRVLGEEHPHTLAAANNLASALSDQGKHAQPERIRREVLAVTRWALDAEHPHTLTAANLALDQGEHAEPSGSMGEVLGVRRWLLGEEHPDMLMAANSLALSPSDQGKES